MTQTRLNSMMTVGVLALLAGSFCARATLPQITAQPQSVTNGFGAMVSFSVTATNSPPLSYQWWKDNLVLPDATNDTYSLASLKLTNAGAYFVIVTNNYGSVTSEVATLTVTNAPLVTGTSGNDTLFFQGWTEQLTMTLTNAYSGEVLSLNDIYNGNTAIYDGLGGTDTLLMSNAGDFLTIRDGGGNQTLFSVEQIVAGNGGDVINLSDPTIVLGNTYIQGGAGDDILWGNAGNDWIVGGDGNDNIIGGPGNDTLNGNNDNDTLDGGSGNDIVTGDAGDDMLIYTASENVGATDYYDGGPGTDTLVLRLTPTENAAAAAEIAAAQTFITNHYDTTSTNGPSYTFSSFNLTFSNIEVLEVELTGSNPVITLSPDSPLPDGRVGSNYSQTISASGGTAPYTFTVTSGSLPGGLDLSGAGSLSGAPTNQGNFNFTITATDSNGYFGSLAYTLFVACPAIALSPTNLPDAVAGTAYGLSLAASGGLAPYTFALAAGALPGGLTLSAAGDLSGSPTNSGPFNFTVTATDADGCVGGQAYALTVFSPASDFTYTTNSGAITITGYIGSGGNVAIPGSINGYPVTSIGDNAFNNNTTVTGLTLPDSVTNIGAYAFYYCSGLTSVTIGSGVMSIGESAFESCSALTSVTIPNSVTDIGTYAFDQCSGLTNLTIGNSVSDVGDSAFYGCSGLTSVMIPDSLTNIGYEVFASCSGLTNIVVPDSVTSIGIQAFAGCSGLTSVTLGNRVTDIGDGVFFGCSSLTSVTIPDSVINLGIQVFGFCSGLTSVTLGNRVTDIGSYAFEACSGLTNVTIPGSVTNIGYEAFVGCSSLTNVTIGNGVTSIGDQAFLTCYALTSVTIPNSVTNLGQYAFYNCTSLHQAYFRGNAPSVNGGDGSADTSVFYGESGTVYYLPGTTGWGATFGGWSTVLWNPQMQTTDSDFGIRTNRFGFNVTGTTNIPVVVEGCTNLEGAWISLFSGTLTNGSIYFSDLQWTNYPQRFYRVRSP